MAALAGPPGAGDGTPRPAPGSVIPRQLPAAVRPFAGRQAELKALTGLLEGQAGPGDAVVISAIGGTAGIGKTALAVHFAHQVANRFRDGQLYVNLRGFDASGDPVTSAQAVRWFLDALGAQAERIPADPDAQAGLYRSLLVGKRVLIVLDNARDSAQVRPLLPASGGCLVLVTSRQQLTELIATGGAEPITLDVLSAPEAQELLAGRLGAERADREPGAVTELVGECAGLPLALAIAAARARARPGVPLAVLVAELRDARARLDALDTGETATDVRAVFSWSYQRLTPAAALMFRLLGVHPGPDITAQAAASLAGATLRQAGRTLRELTGAHLLAEHAAGRFSCHDLLRAYAAERAIEHDSGNQRRAAIHRVLDHYLNAAHAADRLLYPARNPITLAAPQPGVVGGKPTSQPEALAWFEAEHRVLLAAVNLAARTGFGTYAWQLAWTLATFLDRRGYWPDWVATERTALAAAYRADDRPGQAYAHRSLGLALLQLGSYDDALYHLSEALKLREQAGDHAELARCHVDISWVLDQRGQFTESLGHARRALGLLEATGDRAGQAGTLNSLAVTYGNLGDYRQALTCGQQALSLCRELGDRRGETGTLDTLGLLQHRLGNDAEAIDCYRRALDLCAEFGSRHNQADVLSHLGEACRAAGNPQGARLAWRQALEILEDMQHPDAAEVRARLGRLPSQ